MTKPTLLTNGVFSYLDISTVHISRWDMTFLTSGNGLLTAIVYPEGAFVVVPEAEDMDHVRECFADHELSDELFHILEEAVAMKCMLVRFDADGTVFDHLRKFDW